MRKVQMGLEEQGDIWKEQYGGKGVQQGKWQALRQVRHSKLHSANH